MSRTSRVATAAPAAAAVIALVAVIACGPADTRAPHQSSSAPSPDSAVRAGDPLLFAGDTTPRMLQIADEYAALSADEIGGPADGPWWALGGTPVALRRVNVVTGAIPHPCTPDDTSLRAHTVRLAADAGIAEHDVVALLRGLPLVEGPVPTAIADSVFMAPESPAGGADSALFTFDGRPLRIWSRVAGEGFELRAEWDGRTELIYATDLADEGSWEPVLIADINRDAVPDLLLQATHKYSVHVLRLLLSQPAASGGQFVEVARSGRSAC